MSADLQRHPLSAAFGDMPVDEFDQLVDDIKRNGLVQTIVTIRDEHGTEFVLDGWHRYRACIEAGVKPRTEPFDYVVEPADEQAGKKMTPAEFVVAANAHRRHLTREQRRQIVVELLRAKPEASDRVIAAQAKVSPTTVGTVRRELEAGVQIGHHPERVGKDGKKQPVITRVTVHPVAQARPVIAGVLPQPTAARKLEILQRDYEIGMRAAAAHAARQPKLAEAAQVPAELTPERPAESPAEESRRQRYVVLQLEDFDADAATISTCLTLPQLREFSAALLRRIKTIESFPSWKKA